MIDTPTRSIAPAQSPVRRLIALLALSKSDITQVYFYAAFAGLLTLTMPMGIQAVINVLVTGIITTTLLVLIILIVVGVLASGWFQVQMMHLSERIQRRLFASYSLRLAHRVPRIDLLAVDQYDLPELLNRFFEIPSLQKGVSKILLDIPSALIQVLFGVILLSFYHPFFIVFALSLIGLTWLIIFLTGQRGLDTSIDESHYKYRIAHWLEEVARSIHSFKFMSALPLSMQYTDRLASEYLDARELHFRVLVRQYWIFVLFKVLVTAILLIAGSILLTENKINLGQLIASEIVILMVLNSVEKLVLSLDVMYDLLTSLEKIAKIIDAPVEIETGTQIERTTASKGMTVTCSHLTFAYHDPLDTVINDLSFTIPAGERVCIMGDTRSGKSTLLKLLAGAYTTYTGTILVNQLPMQSYHIGSLRQHLGIILGGSKLFSGSLRDNITMGDTAHSSDQILAAAAAMGLLPYIQSLPRGLDTEIDSTGKNLSRLVINRILLARVYLRQPLLSIIENTFDRFAPTDIPHLLDGLATSGSTMIIVSNRPEVATHCQRVLYLRNGRLILQGTYAEVSAQIALNTNPLSL
jgi:ATP-binding cassette, subfamily B, bacterial